MDKIIERALQHWYAPDHELYGDPLPALMGIVGESGELCDLWKKKLYKPGYVFDRDAFLDELGDVLFYAVILCHYCNIDTNNPLTRKDIHSSIINEISVINYHAAVLLDSVLIGKQVDTVRVANIVCSIRVACQHFDITLDQLSELNHAKLNERAANGEGYNRGEEKEEFVICGSISYCDAFHCLHRDKHKSRTEKSGNNCTEQSGLCQCIPYTDNQCSE